MASFPTSAFAVRTLSGFLHSVTHYPRAGFSFLLLLVGLVLALAIFHFSVIADVSVAPPEPGPWKVNTLGPYPGSMAMTCDDTSLTINIDGTCVTPNVVTETFTGNDATPVTGFGFASHDPTASENLLTVAGGRLVSQAGAFPPFKAPTSYLPDTDMSVSARISSELLPNEQHRSIALYLAEPDGGRAVAVYYHGDGVDGQWRLAEYSELTGNETVVSYVSAVTHPDTAPVVTLELSGNIARVLLNDVDINLTHDLAPAGFAPIEYGILGQELLVGPDTYIDDINLTQQLLAPCPELNASGLWDERYPVQFVHQDLLVNGQITARLVSHNNRSDGEAGIVIRDGLSQLNPSVALTIDSSDDEIKLYVRDVQDGTTVLHSKGAYGALPQWLRLKRTATAVEAYTSVNGSSWTLVDSVPVVFAGPAKAGVGLAVTGLADQQVVFDNLDVHNPLPATISQDTTLRAHQRYHASGNISVASGVTLSVEPGATVRFANNARLTVQSGGLVVASGTAAAPAVFTSASVPPVRGSWNGVLVNTGGEISFDHVRVDYAVTGISFEQNSIGTVSNSEFSNNTHGIYITDSSPALTDNLVADNYLTGITILRNSAPVLDANTITGTYRDGVYIQGASSANSPEPLLTHNIIYDNGRYGIYVNGSSCQSGLVCLPQPVINHNSIYDNNVYNFTASNFGAAPVALNAMNNWWGTSDPSQIAIGITDRSDNASSPFVDFRGFLDSEGGTPIAGEQFYGPVTSNITLSGVGDVLVLGKIIVSSGATLTVEAGKHLNFISNGRLEVQAGGHLEVNGTPSLPVKFGSNVLSPSVGIWDGIRVLTGGDVDLANAQVEYADHGIYFESGSAGTVSGSAISNNTHGVYIDNASPELTDNVFANNITAGVYIYRDADPILDGNTITGSTHDGIYVGSYYSSQSPDPLLMNNIITGNGRYGIYMRGILNCQIGKQCRPSITANYNSIHNNNIYDFFVSQYGVSDVLDASNNWWGTTDPSVIAANIYDRSDDPLNPYVDFGGFLDSEGGSPVPGEQLYGDITGATVIPQASNVLVLGKIDIASGASLTLESGARIEFINDGRLSLLTNAQLIVNGTEQAPVIFSHYAEAPAIGAWDGIRVKSGGGVDLLHARVEYADHGVYFESGSDGLVSLSRLFKNTYGVYIDNASPELHDNLIEDNVTAGVYIYRDASPLLDGNTITGTTYDGIYVKTHYASAAPEPVIINNTVIDNQHYGVRVVGSSCQGSIQCLPKPLVNQNNIYNNSGADYFTSDFNGVSATLDAKNNWWGTANPSLIAANIHDYMDHDLNPHVDFSGFLTSEGGTALPVDQLSGPIASNMVINNDVLIIGDVVVEPGVTVTVASNARLELIDQAGIIVSGILEIEAGAQLEFGTAAEIRVGNGGSVNVDGSEFDPAVFTSSAAIPGSGNWQGINIEPGGSIHVDYAVFHYATQAINADAPAAFVVENSAFRFYSDRAISISNSASGTISANLIQGEPGVPNETGIYVDKASPTISNNIIRDNYQGIYIRFASAPVITGNTLVGNDTAVYLHSGGSDSTSPVPTMTGNNIHNSISDDVYFSNYSASTSIAVDFTGNYWGGDGTPDITISGNRPITIDTSGVLVEPVGNPSAPLSLPDGNYFSPNSDGVRDVLNIAGQLESPANWSLNIAGNGSYRTLTGTGSTISVAWDGLDNNSAQAAEGLYHITLRVGGQIAGNHWVVLDRTLPVADIQSPANSQLIFQAIDITGTVFDTNILGYQVAYRPAGSTGDWTAIHAGATNLMNAALANWLVASVDGSSAGVPDGNYELMLGAEDMAGNTQSQIISVAVATLRITNVSHNSGLIDTGNNELLQVNFDVSDAAQVTLRILTEKNGELVREISQSVASAGTYQLTWDGKDGAGNFVADEAYEYILQASAGNISGMYDPPAGEDPVVASFVPGATNISAGSNHFYEASFSIPSAGRINFPITPTGQLPVYPLGSSDKPLIAGSHTYLWNGRNAEGQIANGGFILNNFDDYIPFPPNVIIVDGTPRLAGLENAPSIAIKSDPYRVFHSFDQISTIAFNLDQDAYITFKLLPPGVSNPNHASAVTLVDNELKFANDGSGVIDHTVQWTGYDDPDSNNVMVAEEGIYSFWIQATSAVTGGSTEHYGALQLYR